MLRKKKRIVTGIDIGSEAIKIAQIKNDGEGFILSNWAIINISEHLKGSKLTQMPPKNLSHIIKAELDKIGLSVVSPSIATSSEDMLFKYFFLPKSVRNKIVPLLGLIVSPIPSPELIFGFCRINGVSRLKKNELIIVGLVRDNVLEFMYKFHNGLGNTINHSVPRAVAMYNLVTYIKDAENGSLYFCADIGNENIDMAIVIKTNPDKPVNAPAFFRSVRLKTPQNNYETTADSNARDEEPQNRQFNIDTPDNTFHHTVYDEIQQAIAICRRELKLSKLDISKFMITGEKSYDYGLREYLSKRLNKDVKILDPVTSIGLKIRKKKISSSGKDHENIKKVCYKADDVPPCMATAIGLSLGMLTKLPVYIKLEPRFVRIEKKKKKNLSYLKAAMAVVVAAVAMVLYHGFFTMKVYRDNAGKAERTLSQYIRNESLLLGMSEGQKKLGKQLWKLKNISSMDFSRDVLAKFLEIEPPPEIAIKDIDIITVGGFKFLNSARWVRLNGEVKATEIAGVSPLEFIKDYVTKLESVESFEKVKFREIKEQGNQSATFQIEFLTN